MLYNDEDEPAENRTVIVISNQNSRQCNNWRSGMARNENTKKGKVKNKHPMKKVTSVLKNKNNIW